MTDQVLVLLQDIVRLSDGHIADQCPRHDSEPFISIWEVASRLVTKRSSRCLLDPDTGDYRTPIHATPDGIIDRLASLRDRLSDPDREGRGMYGEIAEIGRNLDQTLTFA